MKRTDQKFLILVIDGFAIVILFLILYIALTHDGNGNTILSSNSNNSVSQSENSVIENLTNSTDSTEEKLPDNTVSDNSLSENSISENSISDNSLSDNSASENIPLYSYDLPGAPKAMSKPSGTVLEGSEIDVNNLKDYFIISEVPDDIFEYINGKSYQENTSVSLNDLRYIKLVHFNYEHKSQVGEIIVNEKISKEVRDIFMALYLNGYEIESIYLPDKYWTGDGNDTDFESCDANNTSGFFYRTVDGSTKLSNHAKGMAIDINPKENPYVSYTTGAPVCGHENALAYIDRNSGLPHMISPEDQCYKLFTAYGFKWGGAWNTIKDYQHFEK